MTFKEIHNNYERPIKKCGIYIIINNNNNKKYIGKSNDINRRIKEHLYLYELSRTPNKPLYLAFQKYGTLSFHYEILEECEQENLNEREKYWISFYETTNSEKGYNITPGGDGFSGGELHDNHKLTKQDVVNIRIRYNNRERRMEVEKDYAHKIGPSGFKKIWQGITWSDIMPEVYTEENKNFHKNNTGLKGQNNGRAILKEEDVYNIRMRKANGEKWQEVYKDYEYTRIKKSSFQYTWQGHNWKHIVIE